MDLTGRSALVQYQSNMKYDMGLTSARHLTHASVVNEGHEDGSTTIEVKIPYQVTFAFHI